MTHSIGKLPIPRHSLLILSLAFIIMGYVYLILGGRVIGLCGVSAFLAVANGVLAFIKVCDQKTNESGLPNLLCFIFFFFAFWIMIQFVQEHPALS